MGRVGRIITRENMHQHAGNEISQLRHQVAVLGQALQETAGDKKKIVNAMIALVYHYGGKLSVPVKEFMAVGPNLGIRLAPTFNEEEKVILERIKATGKDVTEQDLELANTLGMIEIWVEEMNPDGTPRTEEAGGSEDQNLEGEANTATDTSDGVTVPEGQEVPT